MQEVIKQVQEKLDKAIDFFQSEIASVRTGRANSMLVEDIKVEVYGQSMRVKDVASVTIPDATSILISPWDKSNLKLIEDSLNNANLGVSVVNTGESIRVVLPELSLERREELKKMVQKKAEEVKVSMRNIRREAVDKVKKQEKNKEISEDERDKYEEKIQELLDEKIKELDGLVGTKEKEIVQ